LKPTEAYKKPMGGQGVNLQGAYTFGARTAAIQIVSKQHQSEQHLSERWAGQLHPLDISSSCGRLRAISSLVGFQAGLTVVVAVGIVSQALRAALDVALAASPAPSACRPALAPVADVNILGLGAIVVRDCGAGPSS
jgi:hypothetical protein